MQWPPTRPGRNGRKFHLVPAAAKHLGRVEAEAVEEHRELVDQRDVDVALGVLDHLGGLGHADARGLVGAGGDHRAVERVDEVGDLGRRAGGDLDDAGQAVLLVARVDALRAVARVEVAVVDQPGFLLQDRHADFLGRARIDRGFVDHHVAALERAADAAAGRLQRAEVRPLELVDRGRHGDDDRRCSAQGRPHRR